MRNEFYQHKKSDKIKWIGTSVAFLLTAVMLVGFGLQIFGTGKQQPSNWFKKTEQTTPATDDKKDENKPADDKADENKSASGGMIIPAETVTKTMRLTAKPMSASVGDDNLAAPEGIATYASNSYSITATITPADATDKTVDWTVSPSDGKVTVTPTSDGALTATVSCTGAFSTPYTVTVTSRSNSNASASCTINYAKRISSLTLPANGRNLSFTTSGSTFTETSVNHEMLDDITGFTPSYGAGTVNDSFTYSYKITYTTAWINALKAQGCSVDKTAGTQYSFPSEGLFIGKGIGMNALAESFREEVSLDILYGGGSYYNKFSAAQRAMNGGTLFTITVTATGSYSTFTGSCNMCASTSIARTNVTGVSANKSNLTF